MKMDYTPSSPELDFVRKRHETSETFISVHGPFRTLLLAELLGGETIRLAKTMQM